MARNGLKVQPTVSLRLMIEMLSNNPMAYVDGVWICLLISCLKSTQLALRMMNGLPEVDASNIVFRQCVTYGFCDFEVEIFWGYVFGKLNAGQIGQLFIMSVLPDYRNVDSTISTRVGLLLAHAFATSQRRVVAPWIMPASPDNDINMIFNTIRANGTKPSFQSMVGPLGMFGFPKRENITWANLIGRVTGHIDVRGQGNALVSNSKSLSARLASTSNPEHHLAIDIFGHEDDHVPKKAFGFDTKAAFSSVWEIVFAAAPVPLIPVAFDNIRDYRELYPADSGDQVRVTGFCFLTLNTLMFLVSIYIVMAFAWSKLSQGGRKAFYVKSLLSVVMGFACLIFALMVYRCF